MIDSTVHLNNDISLADYIVSSLMDAANPFNASHVFLSPKEVYRYFGVDSDNDHALLKVFDPNAKKTAAAKNARKLAGLTLIPSTIGLCALDYFKQRALSQWDITIIADMLAPLLTNKDIVINLLATARFTLEKDENYDSGTSPSTNRDEAHAIFAKNLIQHVSDGVVEAFMANRDSTSFKEYARFFYQVSIKRERYTFALIDVALFSKNRLYYNNIIGTDYFVYASDTLNKCTPYVIAALDKAYHDGVLSANDIKCFLVGERDSYDALIGSYPALNNLNQIAACHALETLDDPYNALHDIFRHQHRRTNSTQAQSPLNFLDEYGDKNRFGVVCILLAKSFSRKSPPDSEAIIHALSTIDASILSGADKELWSDLVILAGFKCNNPQAHISDMTNIGISILINGFTLPALPVLSFEQVQSDNWWDGGVGILYDKVNIQAHDVTSTFADHHAYWLFARLLTQALKAKAYYLIAAQSYLICKMGRTVLSLPHV